EGLFVVAAEGGRLASLGLDERPLVPEGQVMNELRDRVIVLAGLPDRLFERQPLDGLRSRHVPVLLVVRHLELLEESRLERASRLLLGCRRRGDGPEEDEGETTNGDGLHNAPFAAYPRLVGLGFNELTQA